MPNASPAVILPAWAVVTDKRRAHIQRVTDLLDRWARDLRVSDVEAQAWHDVGRWHDALRDATPSALRAELGATDVLPDGVLHGPAAARRLRADGEAREDVLNAIEWHTLGNPSWGRLGRALFMADFLEPGRNFATTDRAFLASMLHADFDGVFRQVVRMRMEWTLREGKQIYPETVALWNAVR